MSLVSRIAHVLQEAIAQQVFPGGVLLVRVSGEILCQESIGVQGEVPFDQPVTLHTRYDLASLTKPLATTSAIVSLIQAGTIQFDQALSGWVEELRDSPFGTSTVRQLLSHSAGLPAWKPYYLRLTPTAKQPAHEPERQSRLNAFLSYVSEEPLEYRPGSKSVYSDLGFILLGLIVERSTGESLATYCHRHVFQPLHITTCGFLANQESVDLSCIAPTEADPWRGRMLHGEVHDENAYALGGFAGHAGLFGTVEGVSRMTQEWLRGVQGHSTLLSPALIRECVRRQDPTGESSWALGWDTPTAPSSSGKYFSGRSFGHLGYTGTSVWIDPVRNLEVIFLSNRVHPTRQNSRIQRFRPYIHDVIGEVVGKAGCQ